jgi:hypothetical protein
MRDFPLNFLRAQPRMNSPCLRPLRACICAVQSAWFVSDLICALYFCIFCAIHQWFQWKWSVFSTDKHAQPNFMRNSWAYVLVGLCDRAFTCSIQASLNYYLTVSFYWYFTTQREVTALNRTKYEYIDQCHRITSVRFAYSHYTHDERKRIGHLTCEDDAIHLPQHVYMATKIVQHKVLKIKCHSPIRTL